MLLHALPINARSGAGYKAAGRQASNRSAVIAAPSPLRAARHVAAEAGATEPHHLPVHFPQALQAKHQVELVGGLQSGGESGWQAGRVGETSQIGQPCQRQGICRRRQSLGSARTEEQGHCTMVASPCYRYRPASFPGPSARRSPGIRVGHATLWSERHKALQERKGRGQPHLGQVQRRVLAQHAVRHQVERRAPQVQVCAS